MVCAGISNSTLIDTGITGILAFPTTCDYYFYAKIMGALFIILSLTLYFKDRERIVKADMISCLGISAIATIFISLIGTFLKIIQSDVFIEIFVIGMIFIVIWVFKK